MPAPQAQDHHPDQILDFLAKRGFDGLRARKRGSAVIVESGPHSEPLNHFRVRRDTVHLWRLDFADHRGRWESTLFRGQLDTLLEIVVSQFPWTISNPERI
jgi:hypothetical protein